jgi:hypothetical protein
MGKQFRASTKLTAKFLVMLMVLQAALFAFTAFAETAPASVTIKKGTDDVSGTTLVGFIGVPIALTATPNVTVTTAAYKLNFWHSTNSTAIPVATGNTALKSFTPLAKGTAVLSVFNAVDNTGPTNTVTVNVYRKLTGFTILDAAKLTVKVGKTGFIKDPTLIPSDGDVLSTVYSLSAAESAKGVVTVDSVTGAVYGVKSGTATVTITKNLPGGTSIARTFVVTVPEPVNTLAISTNGKDPAGTTLGINAGKTTLLKTILTSITGPTKKPTDLGVKWKVESGDTSVISIDSKTGLITLTDKTDTAIGKTAVISATANDNWNSAADTITVTVGKELTTLSVTKSTYVLKIGDNRQIIPVFKSSNATPPTITSVTYTAATGQTAILTVDSAGIIHGVGAGTVKITVLATAADGTTKTTFVNATVVGDVTKIDLVAPLTASSTKPMKLYSKVTIKANVTGGSPKLNTVRFKSNDTSIAFVNIYTGEVTAVGVGNTTITASAVTSGATVTATAPVPVFVTDPDGLLTP